MYMQDQYTRGRLTLSGALRWDHASSYAPVEDNGVSMTSKFNPTTISIQETKGVDAYNDLTPRVGAAYDVFGNGKTARQVPVGPLPRVRVERPAVHVEQSGGVRWWRASAATGPMATATKSWTAICSTMRRRAAPGGDTCAVVTGNSANFGKIGAATIVDPKLLEGWGVRTYDYQTEVTLQQEVLPRVSAQVGYNHRTFHGFFVTQDINRNIATDYASYTITAPKDPRLPDGGGYPLTVYVNTTTGAAQNFLTPEATYSPSGEEHQAYYDGVNFDVNARLRGGLFGSIGTQTGRRVDDRCEVQPFLTGGGGPNPRNCLDDNPWQTTIRGLASYTVPKIDVLVSANDPFAGAAGTDCRLADSESHVWLPWAESWRQGLLANGQHDGQHHGQPAPAVRRQPPHADRHAVRQGSALRPDADRRRRRPVEPAEHELRDGVRGHLLVHRVERRDLEPADRDLSAAIHSAELHGQFLVNFPVHQGSRNKRGRRMLPPAFVFLSELHPCARHCASSMPVSHARRIVGRP